MLVHRTCQVTCDPGLRGQGLCLPHHLPLVKQTLIEHLLCARHLMGARDPEEPVFPRHMADILGGGGGHRQ